MIAALDDTHDPALTSWVASANEPATDFPIQNLPFGRFRRPGDSDWRIGVAIGDQVLGLKQAGLLDHDDITRILKLTPAARRTLRHLISRSLAADAPPASRVHEALIAQSAVELGLPCPIRDYTDFYTGIHHALSVGRLFRPDNPLLPNYKWVPIGYHGRASSIQVSPGRFRRPLGQQGGAADKAPSFGPSARLDYELELGLIVGQPNDPGEPIPMASAEEHLFGVVLLNDWSARDIQAWEYQPLGPFLAKNFATTISPWIVTMEALAPFRRPFTRPAGDPAPLPYLDSADNRERGVIEIALEVHLQTGAMRDAGHAGDLLSRSSYADAYWTAAQLVTHHTCNGCNLDSGDLLGTGTLSGPQPAQGGSLLELTAGGRQALTLSDGRQHTFLEDGDTVILRARCERAGRRTIGFGECRGSVLPPPTLPG